MLAEGEKKLSQSVVGEGRAGWGPEFHYDSGGGSVSHCFFFLSSFSGREA